MRHKSTGMSGTGNIFFLHFLWEMLPCVNSGGKSLDMPPRARFNPTPNPSHEGKGGMPSVPVEDSGDGSQNIDSEPIFPYCAVLPLSPSGKGLGLGLNRARGRGVQVFYFRKTPPP